jgi:hypothetical protein
MTYIYIIIIIFNYLCIYNQLMTGDTVGEDEGTCLGSMAAEAPEQ